MSARNMIARWFFIWLSRWFLDVTTSVSLHRCHYVARYLVADVNKRNSRLRDSLVTSFTSSGNHVKRQARQVANVVRDAAHAARLPWIISDIGICRTTDDVGRPRVARCMSWPLFGSGLL
jgi:hypothetical protein